MNIKDLNNKDKIIIWHKDLINQLPDELLLKQFNDCNMIVYLLSNKQPIKNKTIKHLLKYHPRHLYFYTQIVLKEIERRKLPYKLRTKQFNKNFKKWYKNYLNGIELSINFYPITQKITIFKDWHNNDYYEKCHYLLVHY